MKEIDEQNELSRIEKTKYILDKQIDLFLSKIENSSLIVNKLDYYGN